jgi:uncharacterized RDD family membrane protein YckC
VSTPNPPSDGSGQDDAGQRPAPEQSPWTQPPATPYGAPTPPPPPMAPPVAPPVYGQQPPADPYGQQPPPPGPYGQQPADPYGQQQPYAPAAGYPATPYGVGGLPKEAYASWGQRVGAYLLDYVLTLPFTIVGSILYGVGLASLTSHVTYDANGYPTTSVTGVSALAIVGVLLAGVGSLAVTIWNRWYTAGKTGQSWGKRVMGIKLVREADGQPIGAGMAFLRDVAHFVDGLICDIGYLFPLWDAKRQTLADKIVSTAVYPGAPKSSKLF